MAFAFTDGDEASLAYLKQSHSAEGMDLEKTLAGSEEKSSDTERIIQAVRQNKDILHVMLTTVEEAQDNLKSFKEHVRFLEDKLIEQSNRLLAKVASPSGYLKCVVVLEKNLLNTPAEVERSTTQHTMNKNMVDDMRKAPHRHRIALQQGVAADATEREK